MVPQYNFQLQKGPKCAGAYLKYWQEQVKVAHKPAIFNGMKQKFCQLFEFRHLGSGTAPEAIMIFFARQHLCNPVRLGQWWT
jgi:hypothetical protein